MRCSVQPPDAEEVDELPVLHSQVCAIATRRWTDLVNVADYFEPQQEWVKLARWQSQFSLRTSLCR